MKTNQHRFVLQAGRLIVGIFCVLTLASSGWAAFGEDTEKPKPEFARQGEGVVAKLIPRGKSTSVLIEFRAPGGALAQVEAEDFDEAGQAGMDAKDFRSALFAVKADGVSPGGEITLSLASNYFTQATELWALNRGLQTPWVKGAIALPIERPDRVQELVLTVEDKRPARQRRGGQRRDPAGRRAERFTLGLRLGHPAHPVFRGLPHARGAHGGHDRGRLPFPTAGPSGGGFETGPDPPPSRKIRARS